MIVKNTKKGIPRLWRYLFHLWVCIFKTGGYRVGEDAWILPEIPLIASSEILSSQPDEHLLKFSKPVGHSVGQIFPTTKKRT